MIDFINIEYRFRKINKRRDSQIYSKGYLKSLEVYFKKIKGYLHKDFITI